MHVEFKFDIGKTVNVSGTERTGTIILCGVDAAGNEYLVRFIDSNERIQSEWFREQELQS